MSIRYFVPASLLVTLCNPCAAAPHSLITTYLHSGKPGTQMASGLNLVNTTAVRCPQAYSYCTLALSAMDQACGGGIGTAFQIVVMVDGVQVDGGEWVTNNANSGEFCGGGSWADNYRVGPGKHQVQLYTDWSAGTSGVTQGQWSINYAVTNP